MAGHRSAVRPGRPPGPAERDVAGRVLDVAGRRHRARRWSGDSRSHLGVPGPLRRGRHRDAGEGRMAGTGRRDGPPRRRHRLGDRCRRPQDRTGGVAGQRRRAGPLPPGRFCGRRAQAAPLPPPQRRTVGRRAHGPGPGPRASTSAWPWARSRAPPGPGGHRLRAAGCGCSRGCSHCQFAVRTCRGVHRPTEGVVFCAGHSRARLVRGPARAPGPTPAPTAYQPPRSTHVVRLCSALGPVRRSVPGRFRPRLDHPVLRPVRVRFHLQRLDRARNAPPDGLPQYVAKRGRALGGRRPDLQGGRPRPLGACPAPHLYLLPGHRPRDRMGPAAAFVARRHQRPVPRPGPVREPVLYRAGRFAPSGPGQQGHPDSASRPTSTGRWCGRRAATWPVTWPSSAWP